MVPGTNQKSPEPLDSTMVSEIQAEQLPPELPLTVRARRHRYYRPSARHDAKPSLTSVGFAALEPRMLEPSQKGVESHTISDCHSTFTARQTSGWFLLRASLTTM